MPDPKITVRLVGSDEDNGAVRFDDFRIFCDKLAECLRRTEAIVTAQTGQIRYRVAALEASSASVTLEPIPPKKGPDKRQEVTGLFKKTVKGLQTGGKIDPRFDPDALRSFRDLFVPLRKTKEVWIEGGQITTQYVANIDRILGNTVGSRGFVTGRLERLNVHNRNEFVLYPPVLGSYIACQFPETLFEDVRAAIKQTVTVSGTLYYSPDKPFPDRVHVEALEVHPPDSELPKLGELKGILKGCTDGMTSAEFVRSIRDEQEN